MQGQSDHLLDYFGSTANYLATWVEIDEECVVVLIMEDYSNLNIMKMPISMSEVYLWCVSTLVLPFTLYLSGYCILGIS